MPNIANVANALDNYDEKKFHRHFFLTVKDCECKKHVLSHVLFGVVIHY